jgi:hypothetical protein
MSVDIPIPLPPDDVALLIHQIEAEQPFNRAQVIQILAAYQQLQCVIPVVIEQLVEAQEMMPPVVASTERQPFPEITRITARRARR